MLARRACGETGEEAMVRSTMPLRGVWGDLELNEYMSAAVRDVVAVVMVEVGGVCGDGSAFWRLL